MPDKLTEHDIILAAIDQRLLSITERMDEVTQVTLRTVTLLAEVAVMQARQMTAIDGLTAAVNALIDHVTGAK